MTDLRTPECLRSDGIVGGDELVPADDAIIGRAFRWSLLVFIGIAIVITGMVMLMKRQQQAALVKPREYVPPKRIQATVSAPAISFTDITQQAGIDFIHVNGATGDKLLPETMGGGAAFIDFDNDGDQDLLLVNSCDWRDAEWSQAANREAVSRAADIGHNADATTGAIGRSTHALFRNNGDGTFVRQASAFDKVFYGMGVAIGDYDNDGHVDVFVSALGPNHLFRNLGNGGFEDVTQVAGVAGSPDAWSTSSGFIDIDNDGDLDLFVCNYVKWSRDIDFRINYTLTGIGRAYGPPTNFEGTNCYLYRNNGDGTFADISADAGIQLNSLEGRPMGKALGLAPFDVDGDGLLDLLVANDTVRRFFFRNLGQGRFEERGGETGLAFDRGGNATGAMGVDAARYRNDGTLGFVIGNFANEMSSLMVSNETAKGELPQFVDEAITEGIGAPTRLKLKFGSCFFDADLDGRLDILHANGHIEDEIHKTEASQTYEQSAQLFWNAGPDGPACFVEAPASSLGDLARPIVGRGAAYADIDNDGDLDLLLTQVHGRPMLLRNETISPGSSSSPAQPDDASAGGARPQAGPHWVRVKLVGNGTTSNRDAIGAVIELTTGAADGGEAITQARTVMPTRSYLSQVELPVTFGLGDAAQIESLRITWPDGRTTEHAGIPINRMSVITQQP